MGLYMEIDLQFIFSKFDNAQNFEYLYFRMKFLIL